MSEPRGAANAVSQCGGPELREITVIVLSMGLLIFGTFTSLIAHDRVGDFVGNHLGGLGVVGLLASLTGHVAMRKGRSYKTAFILASLVPILLGLVVVLTVFTLAGFQYCGGGVVLFAAIIAPIAFSCLKKRPDPCGRESTADPAPFGAAISSSTSSQLGSP